MDNPNGRFKWGFDTGFVTGEAGAPRPFPIRVPQWFRTISRVTLARGARHRLVRRRPVAIARACERPGC